jgi:cytochrome c551
MRTLLGPLLMTALLTLAACTGGDDTQATDGTDATDDTDEASADLANGATVFGGTCAGCHGADGTGDTGPDLRERVPGKSAAELETIITTGKNYMPAQDITGDDLRDVIAYVLDIFED